MAISPTIPTSFVPRAPVQTPRRRMVSGNNPFLIVSLFIAGVAVVASGGVFLYGQLLDHTRDAKAAELTQAEKNINQQTVQDFIRLRDRFTSANALISSHIEMSQLFDVLEGVTLQNVRFTNLKVTVAGDHSAQLTINGVAKNFNTLASQSNAIAAEKRIKRAIFSGITLAKDSSITFVLTADLDSSLIIGTAGSTVGSSRSLVPTPPVTTPAPALAAPSTTAPRAPSFPAPASTTISTKPSVKVTPTVPTGTTGRTSTTTL